MKCIAILLMIVSLPLLAFTKESSKQGDLELFAFITTVEKETYLNIRITNRGPQERSVPTGRSTLSSTDFPNVLIRYDILTMGTKENPKEWRFIPSLVDLAPVTTRKSETATFNLKLEGNMWSVSGDVRKRIVSIEYMVSD